MNNRVKYRRVVTGLNSAGKSQVIIDGPIPNANNSVASIVWRTDRYPADNSSNEDTATSYDMSVLHDPGSNFCICEFPAGMPAFMHATDTIDYLVILSGHITLILEESEVRLGPGDFAVDRGVMHAWRNDSDTVCVAAVINIPANPVGNGRTI